MLKSYDVLVVSYKKPKAYRIVTPPIVFRLERNLLVILPLHASDARRPSNGSRDLLLDGVVRCDCSRRDTPSATDVGSPLDLHG
jgi:hypothetical protein